MHSLRLEWNWPELAFGYIGWPVENAPGAFCCHISIVQNQFAVDDDLLKTD